jgi:DNA-binding IscR family transcriptional regulator
MAWPRRHFTRSGHPVAELAARHHLSASQVRNLVHACRNRGMLTASPPGRAGGELTGRAIELLKEG